jgi:hypothetical protein
LDDSINQTEKNGSLVEVVGAKLLEVIMSWANRLLLIKRAENSNACVKGQKADT